MHFRDRFARLFDLPNQKLRSNLADFLHLQETLKRVGFNKSPELAGLLYKGYLSMSHVFGAILTDVYNHWFAQGVITDSIPKGVTHY